MRGRCNSRGSEQNRPSPKPSPLSRQRELDRGFKNVKLTLTGSVPSPATAGEGQGGGVDKREDNRRAAYAYGLHAETIATLWLRARLFTILQRNYRVKGGEIDIVAKRGRTIAFVEVKARGALEDAAVAITSQKQRRFRHAANRWIATHPWAVDCTLRADAIFIAPGRLPRHVENAFSLEGDMANVF